MKKAETIQSIDFSSQSQERSRLLLGEKALSVLRRSHVMIVGCGAVGGIAIEALARTGIGRLTIVDFDTFSPGNLNRQIMATIPVMGNLKTAITAERIKQINPLIEVCIKNIKVNDETVATLFNNSVDYVIDAIDSLHPKTVLIETLINRKIPFISAMGAALKTDMSRVRVTSMKKTIQCPLAAFVRKRLRRRGVDLSFPVVYSDECVSDKAHLGEVDIESGRHTMGSIITVTALFGLMCAHEAIFTLINRKEENNE